MVGEFERRNAGKMGAGSSARGSSRDEGRIGGESGIRTSRDPFDSISYRFYSAIVAVNTTNAAAPSPPLPAAAAHGTTCLITPVQSLRTHTVIAANVNGRSSLLATVCPTGSLRTVRMMLTKLTTFAPDHLRCRDVERKCDCDVDHWIGVYRASLGARLDRASVASARRARLSLIFAMRFRAAATIFR